MNLKKAIILSGLVIVLMTATQLVFAQEPAPAAADSGMITSSQPAVLQKENDMQWAWGEVMNLDNQAKTITLKYLDYETDQEKDLILTVDDKTTFENIKSFDELKLKDTLSVDYMIASDNKNIAKNISLEKPEAASSSVAASDNSQPLTPPTEAGQPVVDAAQPAPPALPAAPDLTQPAAQSETVADSSAAANEAPASTPVTPEPAPAAQGQTQ